MTQISRQVETLDRASRDATNGFQALKTLPTDMNRQAQAARAAGQKTVRDLDMKLRDLRDSLARSWWIMPAQTVGAGLVAGLIVLGGMVWLGTAGSSGRVPSAVESAWTEMRAQQTPTVQRYMDGLLAKHR